MRQRNLNRSVGKITRASCLLLVMLITGCGGNAAAEAAGTPRAHRVTSPPKKTRIAVPSSRVQLIVHERSGVTRADEPVTFGVPIPKGGLSDLANVRLLQDGKEIPAQFRATGYWRPSQEIRWLLVDVQASLDANQEQRYTLEYGKSVKRRAAPEHAVTIAEDDTGYSIETGKASYRVSKKRFSLFEKVTLAGGKTIVGDARDGESDRGAFLNGIKATVTRAIPAATNKSRAHLISVRSGNKEGSDDYTLTFTTDKAFKVEGKISGPVGTGEFGANFSSSDGAVSIPKSGWLVHPRPKKGDAFTFRTIPANASLTGAAVTESKILESGPLRTVLRVKGTFGPATAPLMEFTAWYHFHAGSGRVKLAFTLENNDHGGRTPTGNARNANIGGVNCIFFDEMALRLPFAVNGNAAYSFQGDADSEPVSGPLKETVELYQDSSGGKNWNRYAKSKFHPRPNSYVSFKGYRIQKGDRQAAEGTRALGTLSVSGANRGVAVAVRNFWQNFPKAMQASSKGTIEIGLFPKQYASHYPFRSGEHKTHEILFAFHDGKGIDTARSACKSFSDPLRLEPSAKYTASTRALGQLHPLDRENFGAYETRNLSSIGIYAEGVKKGSSIFGQQEKFDFYGWMDYGDVPMDFESGSGQWGMKYDLDFQMVQQYARTQRPEWWNAFAAATRHHADIDVHHQPHHPGIHYVRGGVWAHSLHNEPGHKNPNRNYNHFTKDLSFGGRGGGAMHYMTGYWKAYDSAVVIAENALARYMSPQKDPGDPARNNRMGARGDACTLNRLMEGYQLTGEQRFLERARWQIKSRAFDGRPAKHGRTSLWSSVFYMMALSRYVEMFPEDASARKYLLAHIETLRKATHPKNGIYYKVLPKPDGSIQGSGTCSHYNIMAADALAIGYKLTGEMKYLETARLCFAYGVKNACWKNGPPTYTQIHSANGSTHGNVFMAVDTETRRVGRPR